MGAAGVMVRCGGLAWPCGFVLCAARCVAVKRSQTARQMG